MEINVECGKRLKRARMENGYSQVDFAEITHYSKQTICYIENGKRPLCPDAAQLFAKKLGVREEYLLCKDDFKTIEDLSSIQEFRSRLCLRTCLNFLGIKCSIEDLKNGNFAIITDKETKMCSTKELEHLQKTLEAIEETKNRIACSFVDTCSQIDSENNKQLDIVRKENIEILRRYNYITDEELGNLSDLPFE